jgi:hypothetical protein
MAPDSSFSAAAQCRPTSFRSERKNIFQIVVRNESDGVRASWRKMAQPIQWYSNKATKIANIVKMKRKKKISPKKQPTKIQYDESRHETNLGRNSPFQEIVILYIGVCFKTRHATKRHNALKRRREKVPRWVRKKKKIVKPKNARHTKKEIGERS